MSLGPYRENNIVCGDCLEVMRQLPGEVFQTCITSPPYWGLRDYGLPPQVWGGDSECEHEWETKRTARGNTQGGPSDKQDSNRGSRVTDYSDRATYSAFCLRCGAWRGSLGLEPDPELYVQHLVEIFREVRRVLRDDGTLWLNMGDSYAANFAGGKGRRSTAEEKDRAIDAIDKPPRCVPTGLKPKDLVGIPWRVAFALQEPYYTGRIKDERDRHWLAAMADGEGCFGIRRQRSSGNRNPDWNDCFIPYFTIKMGDSQAIEKIIAITGWGRMRTEHSKVGDDSRKVRTNRPPNVWRLDGNKAVQLARELYPHLVIKQRQAACLHTLDLSNKAKKRGRGNTVPQAVIEYRAAIMAYIQDCNQRRAVDVPDWLQLPPSLYEPGWWLRSDIIWEKPNCMPESVRDRPTKSHEYVFLLAKNKSYYYDQDAIREVSQDSGGGPPRFSAKCTKVGKHDGSLIPYERGSGRNKRTVWTISTKGFSGAHFATFPVDLIEPCIKAGTSERGACPECGAPWERVVEKTSGPSGEAHGYHTEVPRPNGKQAPVAYQRARVFENSTQLAGKASDAKTIGWQPACDCEAGDPIPQFVLDPFIGAGTTGLVAEQLGRDWLGIELNPEYAAMAMERIEADRPGRSQLEMPL